jgi:peptidoglycan hydrolase-like protein with peptidoglycan-binding domain
MKRILSLVFVSAFFVIPSVGQGLADTKSAPTIPVAEKKSTKPPVFRPTKEQIKQVQEMLKGKGLYNGEATGSYNDDTRAAIKSFQKDNGLKTTGTLNRATLEKMGIALTEMQKAIPVSESSYATNDDKDKSPTATKPKRVIFRATKDQINEAQKILKDGGLYTGEQTGKLNDATRAGLRKYQEANGLKVTGTLNQVTLEKMGIALTDKQKANSPAVATPAN